MMIKSGDNPKEALEKMGGGILGHEWNPKTDKLSFPFVFHFGKRKRNGTFEGPPITPATLNSVEECKWTRRTILSATASQYDPNGLVCPLAIEMRIFLREQLLSSGKLNWDEELTPEMNARWNDIVRKLVLALPPTFPRRAMPESVCGPPELIVMSDGSSVAYCAAVYIRWPTQEDSPGPWISGLGSSFKWASFLLLAKARVTPISGISIPRSEANGLLYGVKLAHVALRALRQKPSSVYFLIDSSCIMAAMHSVRGKLTPYLANRRAQIEEYVKEWENLYLETKVFPPQHIPGHRNVADLGTRGLASPPDVCQGSEWQNGPAFLAFPASQWPTSKESFEDIPEEEIIPKFRVTSLSVQQLPSIYYRLR